MLYFILPPSLEVSSFLEVLWFGWELPSLLGKVITAAWMSICCQEVLTCLVWEKIRVGLCSFFLVLSQFLLSVVLPWGSFFVCPVRRLGASLACSRPAVAACVADLKVQPVAFPEILCFRLCLVAF